MAQNRPPPAFQEYAASIMAETRYRVLTLAQRGLLMTLRLECWVNKQLPADYATLARVLGFTDDEIRQALPAVISYFEIKDGQLICTDLENYRAHLQSVKEKQAKGGKQGAAITNGRRKVAQELPVQQHDDATGNPRLSRESSVKLSSVKSSKTQSVERGSHLDQWVVDYEKESKGH